MGLLSHYYIFVIINITTGHTLIYDQLNFILGMSCIFVYEAVDLVLLTYPSSKSLQSDVSTSFPAFSFHMLISFPVQFNLSLCSMIFLSPLCSSTPVYLWTLLLSCRNSFHVLLRNIYLSVICLFRKVSFFKAMKIL